MTELLADYIVLFAVVLVYRANRNIFLSSGITGTYGFITRYSQLGLKEAFFVGLTTFAMTIVAILVLRGIRRIFS